MTTHRLARLTLFCGLAGLALVACGAPTDEEDFTDIDDGSALLVDDKADAASGTMNFYRITRRDTRKCAFPLCGGVYVQRINRPETRCADGTYQAECYVAELDLGALKLAGDKAGRVRSEAEAGRVLFKGGFTLADYSGRSAGRFVAKGAWQGQSGRIPTSGSFYRLTTTGVRCLTTPCPSFHEQKLNSTLRQSLAELDLGASGAPQSARDAGIEATFGAGLLAVGEHYTVSGPGGKMPALRTSEFYLFVKP